MEHQIIRDHETNRSRGFGFIVFEEEEVVDEILSKGNMIDMSGTQVSIYKWTASEQSVNRILFPRDFAPFYSPVLIITDDFQPFHSMRMHFFKHYAISYFFLLLILGGGYYRYRFPKGRAVKIVKLQKI